MPDEVRRDLVWEVYIIADSPLRCLILLFMTFDSDVTTNLIKRSGKNEYHGDRSKCWKFGKESRVSDHALFRFDLILDKQIKFYILFIALYL